jgi:hypothetical protein
MFDVKKNYHGILACAIVLFQGGLGLLFLGYVIAGVITAQSSPYPSIVGLIFFLFSAISSIIYAKLELNRPLKLKIGFSILPYMTGIVTLSLFLGYIFRFSSNITNVGFTINIVLGLMALIIYPILLFSAPVSIWYFYHPKSFLIMVSLMIIIGLLLLLNLILKNNCVKDSRPRLRNKL